MSADLLALLLPLAIAVPLVAGLLSLLGPLRPHALSLLPLAPVPGLLAALLVPRHTSFEAPDLLIGVRLALDDNGAMFLAMASLLWIAAGFYARSYLRRSDHQPRFAAFWCLTLAGNLGVFLAGDVATFYAAFACVSLAAYPLIAHERSAEALRAGRVYIVLAVVGETCLLLGFMMAATSAGSLLVPEIRQALPGAPHPNLTIALLLAGFGIKAGLVPLHLWLPLAHPAAPTPASAALSGAIVKAGIYGLIQFLPEGAGPALWSDVIVAAGLVTAYSGVAVGLTQSHPKVVLAYSTISQMGVIVAVIGTSLGHDPAPGTLASASFYALHHGLAKGALFLGVGVIAASGPKVVRSVMIVMALVGLGVAGLPLTGGALAKLAIKGSFAALPLHLVTLSAVGTTLLVLRFLIVVRATAAAEPEARPEAGLLWPWLATAAFALAVPWLLFAAATGEALSYPLKPENLWSALWPVLAGGILAIVAARVMRLEPPNVPEGDLVVPLGRLTDGLVRLVATLPPLRLPIGGGWKRPGMVGDGLLKVESALTRWPAAGLVLLLFMLGAAATSGGLR
ncbi:complex I subunit 5 family protein [Lutibaculum baratangense]|uniref:NADH:quinone oxidoreductase/Mrp antiporter transmembrane domain-containing protein n=1 Tax=Lutibaculum baratangense AMV1 TaxID=631454 RepID=V4RGP3_9HYPH|nr:proton-conducting transporter membrane subunit [Lutibaculum baratangense]ESR24519.1 hypothetical protein N177_2353 [Lutibaculum baratangense AMV1]